MEKHPKYDKEVREIFYERNLKREQKKFGKWYNSHKFFLFVIIIISVFAGSASGILINNFRVLPNFQPIYVDNKINNEKVLCAENEHFNWLSQNLASQVVSIFNLKNNFVGSGFVLTNDGWIITNNQVINLKKENYILITSDNKIHKIIDLREDDATGVVFVKIDVFNLSPVKMAGKEIFSLGQKVFSIQENKLAVSRIEEINYLDEKISAESSEKLSRLILLQNEFSADYQGAPVFNLKGEVLGISFADEKEKIIKTILPVYYLNNIIQDVLAKKDLSRVYFGIHYIDLSRQKFNSKKGCLIDKVLLNSPAKKSGLKIKDIILKINNDELNSRNYFSELINEYKSGDVVKLEILRNKKISVIEIKLD